MLELQVELRVRSPQTDPEVRAWIDLEPDGGLCGETELLLTRARWIWRGEFELPKAMPAYFLYRLGLKAAAGAEWSLSLRERSSGIDVLTDWDCLDAPKCWLVGTCWVPTAQSKGPDHGAALPARRDAAGKGAAVDALEPPQAGTRVIMLLRRRNGPSAREPLAET